MVPRLGEWKGQTQGWGLWIDQDSHREEDASAVYQAVPQNGGQGMFKTHQSPKENQIKNFTKILFLLHMKNASLQDKYIWVATMSKFLIILMKE